MITVPACGAGARLAIAASELLGTPFRLHGRDPQFSLDCIGLVAACLGRIAIRHQAPRGYRLRNASIDCWIGCAELSGLVDAEGPVMAGDIVLVSPGPGQHHLLICESSRSFIHAHAGLGKVARIATPLPWPILRQWRLQDPN